MSEPAVVSARLIGEIFVERGLVTHEQLEEALVVQARSGEMIGEVLVSSFGVSRIQLASVLAEQWSAMERGTGDERPVTLPVPPVRLVEDHDAVDPESKRPLGEIFVERGMATEEQLDEALRIQSESGERLGEILVRMGVIQRLDLAGALAEQWAGLQKLRPPEPKPVEAWHDLAARPAGADAPTNGSTDLPALQEAVSSIQKQLAALASRPDPDLTTLRAETRAVEQRLAGMEGRVDGLATAEDVARLAESVERLSAEAASAKAQDLAPVLAELADRVAALAADTELADRVAGVEQQVAETGALRADLARLQDDVAQAARVGDLDDLRRRLDEAVPGSLGDRVDELAAGLARLSQRGDDGAANPTHDPQLDARLAEAQVALQSLSERLGSLADRVDGMQAADHDEQDLLKALEGRIATAVERAELDALAEGLQERLAAADDALRDLAGIRSELAARPTRDELVSSVSEVAARIDELGPPVGDDGAADAVAASIADLAARIDGLEPLTRAAAGSTDVDALAAELRAGLEEIRHQIVPAVEDERVASLVGAVEDLRSRLEGLPSRGEVEGLGIQLGARLDEVRALVESSSVEDALAELRGVVDGLASRADRAIERGELDGLQRRLENLVERTEVEGLTARLGARLDEVRALVESSEDDDERLASLVQAVEELRARVEESVARPELAALSAKLESGLEELRRRADPTAQEDRVIALVDGVAELRSYLGVVQGRLDGTVGRADIDELAARLGARVDEVRSLVESSSVEDALAELRGVVDGLASRADRAIERGELDGLQRRLENLVERTEVEGLTARLGARLDEVRALVESSGEDDERLVSLVVAVDELRPQVEAAVARPELAAVSAKLETGLEELRRQIRSGGDDDRVTSLADSVSELRSSLASMQSRLGGAVDRAEVDGLVAQFAAQVDEVRVPVESSSAEDRIAPVEGAVAELRGWLGSVQGRLDGVADRSEVEGLVGQLDVVRARLEDAVGRPEVVALAGDLGARVEEVRALVESLDLDDRVVPVEGAVAELRDAVGELRDRADGAAGRGELDAVVAQIGAVRASVEAIRLEDRVAPVEGAVAELRGWLGSVQGRLDGVAERSEIESLASQLGRRLDELAAVADLRLAELAARDDDIALGAHAAAERVDGLTRDLESTASGLRSELEDRVAGLAPRKRLDRVEGELGSRIAGLEQRVDGMAPATALEALGSDVHERIAVLDQIARDAAAHAASAPEIAARIVHEHLGDMVGRPELAALAGDLDARLAAVSASGADVSAQLAAGLDAIAIELREGLAHLHGRVDELAAGLGHTGGRLAAVEQTAASAATVDEIAAQLAAVHAKVELETSVSDERARATERAIRKGLASLGERLVAGEQAYLEAGTALRRSLERLGAAVVEADARIEDEPLDPPGVGYVAFVPTVDGYRLRPMDGVAPGIGELVELGHDEPAMRVGRVTVSPLPLDRRPCVYLETL